MNGFQAREADNPVKFGKNLIKMIYNIIAAVPYMTGIQTDTHMIRQSDPIKDFPKLFKGAADFAAFSSHGFQQHSSGLLRL